ncbi:MAG TPA: ABC transporter permease, partial [Dehalococcoidia bacterium]|nr:ABC transporter permease [Dehalococcoidia bacterium]
MSTPSQASVDTVALQTVRVRRGRLDQALSLARQKPLGSVSLAVIVGLILMAVFAGVVAPYDPEKIHYDARLIGPGARYWLGADGLGRDVLSRIIYGARVSLYVGLVAVGIGTLWGSTLGLVSGYFGGKLDIVVQRFVDTIMSFPGLILALGLMAMLGGSLNNVVMVLAVVMGPGTSRIVRSAVLSVKENQYIDAAHCIGASNLRILRRHVFPNVTAPILVIASVQVGSAILIEASLSFLGYG